MKYSTPLPAKAFSPLKVTLLVMVCCILLGSGYVFYASQRTKQRIASQLMPAEQLTSLDSLLAEKPTAVPTPQASDREADVVPDEAIAVAAGTMATDDSAGVVVFVNRFPGGEYGRLAVAKALEPDKRALVDLRCARVHMANGVGICLQTPAESGDSDALILLFDEQFQETRRYYLLGVPSRARVSPDGRWAAYTNFVTGHSYTGGVGSFSTDTRIVDMQRDYRVSLEDFQAYRDGALFQYIDFNYWGVTFANDGNRFYATLGTQGKTYIVEGDINAQRVRVITEDAECPSLSPDNRTLVFKERSGGLLGQPHFQLVRYDLATGERTPLAETRSVDDQVAWLDADTIIYSLPGDTPTTPPTTELWTVNITPQSIPQRYLSHAESPAVLPP